jgi:hypothetical protein
MPKANGGIERDKGSAVATRTGTGRKDRATEIGRINQAGTPRLCGVDLSEEGVAMGVACCLKGLLLSNREIG